MASSNQKGAPHHTWEKLWRSSVGRVDVLMRRNANSKDMGFCLFPWDSQEMTPKANFLFCNSAPEVACFTLHLQGMSPNAYL